MIDSHNTELWRVKLATGESRLSVEEIERAFDEGVIDEMTLVLAPGTSTWVTLGQSLGFDDKASAGAKQSLGSDERKEPSAELWSVQLATGRVRAMTIEDIDSAFDAGFIDSNTPVLAPHTTTWSALGKAAGFKDRSNIDVQTTGSEELGVNVAGSEVNASGLEVGDVVKPTKKRKKKKKRPENIVGSPSHSSLPSPDQPQWLPPPAPWLPSPPHQQPQSLVAHGQPPWSPQGTYGPATYGQGGYEPAYGQPPVMAIATAINVTPPKQSVLAIIALLCAICGVIAYPLTFGVGGFLLSVVAIIVGHVARGEIARSQGMVLGAGTALAGLIIAYLSLAVVAPITCVAHGIFP